MMHKILIIEDEIITAIQMQEALEKKGYEVSAIVDNANDAYIAVEQYNPDLIITDINIKGKMDGTELANKIHLYNNTPIIFVTAYSDITLIENAMQSHPFGYIVKPFDSNELYAAVKIASMHSQNNSSKTDSDEEHVRITKELYYMRTEHKLFFDEKEISLTKNENILFHTLFKNKNNFISKEIMEKEIWPDKEFKNDSSLRSLVYRLRGKIPCDCIEINYGQGYRLNVT